MTYMVAHLPENFYMERLRGLVVGKWLHHGALASFHISMKPMQAKP